MGVDLLAFAKRIAKEAGGLIRDRMSERGTFLQKTNGSDLVTEVDKASERLLISRIKSSFPGHWILSEETEGDGDSYEALRSRGEGYGWIIDPIDGTTNFIHGVPHFAVSIGIVRDKEPVIGVIYNPATDELYWASQGEGAYMNGQAVRTGGERTVAEALIATGFYAGDWHSGSPVLSQTERLVGRCRNLRMTGAASLDLCWVASGKLTGYFHRGLKPWDAAAGIVILREAGGTVTDGKGGLYDLTRFTIMATNGYIHQELVELLNGGDGSSFAEIRELQSNEPPPMELLLLADPSSELVEEYIQRGRCFVAVRDSRIIGVYVLLPTRPGTAELVNVAVHESEQGKGIGKLLVNHAVETARTSGFSTIEVGTGSTGAGQLALYQKCGFRMTGLDRDFFVRHYTEEIIDNGMQLRDMVRLSRDL